MEKEITKEIKAKIFALYLGTEIIVKPEFKQNKQIWYCTPSTILNIDAGIKDYEKCLLLLKPLQSITDEDAMNIALMFDHIDYFVDYIRRDDEYVIRFGSSDEIKSVVTIYFNGSLFQLRNGSSAHIGTKQHLKVCQYLQSKGYALPYMDWSVEDLVKMGIYKLNKE